VTFRRTVIEALDRPGGRALLGMLATVIARKYAPDVRVNFRRGMWMHRLGDLMFFDSHKLDCYEWMFAQWRDQPERCFRDAADFWFHVYQPEEGDVIVDVGAGKGEDAIAFSKAVGPKGKVLAIEAHPATFQCLRLFCEENQLDNVIPLNFAIADKPGSLSMSTSANWQESSVVAANEEDLVSVSSITLDDLLSAHGIKRIGLLKMNIEGAEADAIKGMKEAMSMSRALSISCHDFRANLGHGESFRTKALVEEIVLAAGFKIVSRANDPRDYVADQVNAVPIASRERTSVPFPATAQFS
jgi:FkbM family methyltransferase